MKCIAHGSRHLPVTCHLRNLAVCCNTSLRNLLHRIVDPLCRTVGYYVIAIRYHLLHSILWHTSIQYDSVPVFFVLMPTRYDRLKCLPPEIPAFRISLHIQIDISIPLISPKECLLASLDSHKLPILVVKWRLLIRVRKRQTVCQSFLSCCHLYFSFPVLRLCHS